MDICLKIAEELKIQKWQVEAVVSLIDEGNTIPFIARYRKEKHGSLDDERIIEDWDQLLQFVEEMGDGDFFIVEDKLHPRQFFQGCCHIDNEGRWFQLEYAIHDWTWQFSKTIHPYEEGCRRLIMRFKNGGFPAIQETCSWRQMYIKESDLSRSGLRYPDGNPR